MKISGGDKLEAALKRIATNLEKAASVDVGFMGGATETDGTLVAAVAAYNEFGTTTIPPRPFFRSAIAKNSAQWPDQIAGALKANDYDSAKALDLVGQEIQEEIQQSIIETNLPPLAPSTIARKGSAKPLVDTATMLNGVTHRVRQEKS
jgi:hypothetical protein